MHCCVVISSDLQGKCSDLQATWHADKRLLPGPTAALPACLPAADAYHNSISSRGRQPAPTGRQGSALAGDEGFLDGVPDLAGKSSLSKDVHKDRGLTTSKLGIAGRGVAL